MDDAKRGRLKKRKGESILPRLSIHPLFFLLGLWYLFRGDGWLFFISAIVALQHEYAHAFAAAKVGERLNKVVLMPYGAVLDGELQSATLKEEIFVALAGPICNLLTALFFVAIWWIFPESYAFTDEACFSSASIALVNLLPAYPLDGGRVVFCLLKRRFLTQGKSPTDSENSAKLFCRIIALFIAAILFLFFILLAVKKEANYTLLLFSIFVAVGAFGNGQKTSFERIPFLPKHDLSRGAEVRRVAVSTDTSLKRAVCFLERGRYLVLDVYEKDKLLGSITENELLSALERLSFHDPIIRALKSDNP